MTSKQVRDDMRKELSTLSCPFTWQLADASKYYMRQKLNTNVIDDNIDEEAYLSLEKLITSLVIVYENVLFCKIDCANEKLNKCEKLLLEMKDMHEDEDIMRVIEHIVNSTKCHFFFEINNIEKLKIILPTIIETSGFSTIELAALAGCQSIAWSMFMDFGSKKAMDLASQAILQHSDKALWHFILAKNARQDRRRLTIYSRPVEIEKKHFVLAYEKSSNPVFGIYLVQMYHESFWSSSLSERNNLDKILFDLYKEIFQLSGNNYKILLKLALGLMRIKTFTDSKLLAKDCLDIIAKIEPNNSTYFHYKGIYCEINGNVKEALEFYKKGGELYNYPAEMDYVKCGWRTKMLDPLTHLQSMLIKYDQHCRWKKQELYLCIATCYYQRKDSKHAMEYYLKAIEADPKNKKLKCPFKFLNFSTRRYQNGIYGFLKIKFLKIAENSREYRTKDKTFVRLCHKLETLCYLYDKGLDNNRVED